MNPHIFVYGSLLSGERHPMGQRLAREADPVGPATLAGRLYAVSWYPGAVESTDPADHVHGEVYRLHAPADALRWLDEYEGLTRAQSSVTEDGEYARLERTVALSGGGTVLAWVYLYRRDVADKRRIPSGRWADR